MSHSSWMDHSYPENKIMRGSTIAELEKRIINGNHKPLSKYKKTKAVDGQVMWEILVKLNGRKGE